MEEALNLNNINWNSEWYEKYNLTSINFCPSQLWHVSNAYKYIAVHVREVTLQPLEYVLLSSCGLGYTSYGAREGERHIINTIALLP